MEQRRVFGCIDDLFLFGLVDPFKIRKDGFQPLLYPDFFIFNSVAVKNHIVNILQYGAKSNFDNKKLDKIMGLEIEKASCMLRPFQLFIRTTIMIIA